MAKLSISKAWDESRQVLRQDGKLLGTVGLALIVLPGTVQALVAPVTPPGQLPEPGTWLVVALVAIIVGLIGQLAIVRLAIGPQTSVGDAIGHGARRMPVYLAAMLMWVVPILLVMVLLASSLRDGNPSGIGVLVFFLLALLALYLAVRLIISSAVTSAENIGPVGVLRRSWALTGGNWWRLFGFMVLFLIAVMLVMIAVGALIGIVVGLAIGAPEPMSIGALIIALVTQLIVAAVTVVFLVMVARIYTQLAGTSENVAEVFR